MRAKTRTITTDSDGAATATIGMPTCKLHGILISATTATGGTVDVANMGRDVLDAAAANVNALHQVREEAVNADGVAITGSWVEPAIHGPAVVTVAGGGDTKTLTITMLYE